MSLFGPQQQKSRDEAHVLAGTDIALGDVFADFGQQLRTNQEAVTKLLQQTQGRAAVYNAYNVTLNPGQPYNVLPMDLSRLLVRIIAEAAGVQIGNLGAITAGGGFRLPANTALTLEHTDSMWLINTGAQAVIVNVYEEKTAQ